MSSSVAFGVIVCYQVGYGIAAFGTGPPAFGRADAARDLRRERRRGCGARAALGRVSRGAGLLRLRCTPGQRVTSSN
jgi:hypothetical protein